MRALVTGSARGIGRAIALRLARDAQAAGGARLTLADLHAEALDAVADELRALGAQVRTVAGDLADAAFASQVAGTALDAFGGLDALVSNAGFSRPGTLRDYPVDLWDRIFAVNTRAPLLLGQATHDALAASRGAIVVVTSVSGTHATSPLGAYSPSKAAALMLVRQMATEWGPDGIRVNALSPGLVMTPGTAAVYADPAARAARAQRIPLRRVGEPDDMAKVVAFLLGPDAAYVNGAEIVADGALVHTLMSSLPMGGWHKQL